MQKEKENTACAQQKCIKEVLNPTTEWFTHSTRNQGRNAPSIKKTTEDTEEIILREKFITEEKFFTTKQPRKFQVP